MERHGNFIKRSAHSKFSKEKLERACLSAKLSASSSKHFTIIQLMIHTTCSMRVPTMSLFPLPVHDGSFMMPTHHGGHYQSATLPSGPPPSSTCRRCCPVLLLSPPLLPPLSRLSHLCTACSITPPVSFCSLCRCHHRRRMEGREIDIGRYLIANLNCRFEIIR